VFKRCSDLSELVDCLAKQNFDSLTVKPVLERTMVQFVSHRQRPLPVPHVMFATVFCSLLSTSCIRTGFSFLTSQLTDQLTKQIRQVAFLMPLTDFN